MAIPPFIMTIAGAAQQSGSVFDILPPWIWLMLLAVIVVQAIAIIRRRRNK